ncbi:hypothetical protein BV25DRAFT_1857413 [Artomyces pyxidatus]|uniref:Uncharacterized protein n=1 Tax=Artomyces pyxidatus TaxID=48021 RepID=A0ACB8T065_9AGAM|nr:hypothetical protein BV25DRAFT_1857413 [Artomyces pyxidatus]
MTLPTPPGTSRKEKENCASKSTNGRVVWSQHNKFHNLSSPPRRSLTSSAKKEPPARSILKRNPHPLLPLFIEKQREETPEPSDPLIDLHYLEWPVSKIIAGDASLRDLIEAYSVLAARLRAAVCETTDGDCSWPLFQPLRKNSVAFVDAVVRDLGRAIVDPLARATQTGDTPSTPVTAWTALPSPKSPKKRAGMTEDQVKHARDLCTTTHAVLKLLAFAFTVPAVYRVFTDDQLGSILTQALAIPLANELPTPNARKTCALAIWLIQSQRLPIEVLAPAKDRITYALRRAIEGELGKEGKKGSASDGLRAIHDLSLHEPSVFVPAFTELLPSALDNLLAPTLNLRAQACHAIGGFALASSQIPPSPVHSRISGAVASFLTAVPPSPRKPNSNPLLNTSPTPDPLIVRTLRTTLNANDPVQAPQGPVWAISVIASFIVLLGPRISSSVKIGRILSALLSLAMRHKKSSVRALTCLAWRPITWAYFQPPLLQDDGEDGEEEMASDDDQAPALLSRQEEDNKEAFWRVVRSVIDMGAGMATVAALLANRTDDEGDLAKVIVVLKAMVHKGGYACRDAMEIMRRLVGSETVPDWSWSKLLPRPLFSVHPGLLTAEFKTLSSAVKPIVDDASVAEDVRPLTKTELRIPAVFDGLIEVWRDALTQVNLSTDAQLPSEVVEIWRGLLTSAVSGLQGADDDDALLKLAERIGSILSNILEDPDVQLVPKPETPPADHLMFDPEIVHNPALTPHARSNAAMKLSVTRDLWECAHQIVPAHEIGVASENVLAFLMEKESSLVWETDSPHDAREQWALLCTEMLVHCRAGPLKVFWGMRSTSKKWEWGWSAEVRSLVWRNFAERWREIACAKWENALVLLGVPFADRDAWDMTTEDLDVWDATLQFCIDKSLDEGVDSSRVLDHVASIISSTHIPTSTSSTRVADILLSRLDISDAVEVPATLLEFVNDTLESTYPPEPRNKVVSMWLLRTVTRVIDSCPVGLLQSAVQALQAGLSTWVADEYRVFSHEEYSFDVVPVYEAAVVCAQSLYPSSGALVALAPLLESGFIGREDKPESVAQTFRDFWAATYAGSTPPQDGWPQRLLAYLPTPVEEVASMELEPVCTTGSVLDVADLFAAGVPDSDTEESIPALVRDAPRDVPAALLGAAFAMGPTCTVAADDEEPVAGPSTLAASPIRPAQPQSLPVTPKTPLCMSLSTPPHRRSKNLDTGREQHTLSPVNLPFSARVVLPVTPSRSPRTPRKVATHDDKENASPRPVIASVMERIAMQSPTLSHLGKRGPPESLAEERPAKKGRLNGSPVSIFQHRNLEASPASNDSEEDRLLVERDLFSTPSSSKYRPMSTPSPLKRPAISARSFYDSVASRRRSHIANVSPSPTPSRKRKGIFMDAVEVPLLRDVRKQQRRESAEGESLVPRGSLRRVQSLNLPGSSRRTGPPSKRPKLRVSSSLGFSSSPLRALEDARIDSDDSVIASHSPALDKADVPSSDDDPHVGQVTPHHLVSPAMRRLWDSDPPSDDSNASVSPSREHVARRIFQRLGSGSQLNMSSPRLAALFVSDPVGSE